jgi:hypothetical protein
MPKCAKCSQSIKPAALACTVGGKEYHPTCVNCCRCERGLWGKAFVRTKDGRLQCERPCTPCARPASVRSSSAQLLNSKEQAETKISERSSNNFQSNDYNYSNSNNYNDSQEEIKINKKGINLKGVTGKSRYSNLYILNNKSLKLNIIFDIY